MLKLIQLEWKKIKITHFLVTILIVNLLLILWCVGNDGGRLSGYPSFQEGFADIHTYVWFVWIIFAAVLTTKIIITEYNQRTISVLFTYPIPRIKLIGAKLILISVCTFVLVILSSIIVSAALVIHHTNAPLNPDELTANMITEETMRMIILATAIVGINLISFFVGMLQKSVATTITTACVMALASSGSTNESMCIITLIMLGCLLTGILLAYLAMRNIEIHDVT